MDIFISHPGLALLPAFLFFAADFHHRIRSSGLQFSRLLMLGAGVVWLLYAIYEFTVQRGVTQDSVPIRVDLLLMFPVLLIVTLLGTVAYAISFRSPSSRSVKG